MCVLYRKPGHLPPLVPGLNDLLAAVISNWLARGAKKLAIPLLDEQPTALLVEFSDRSDAVVGTIRGEHMAIPQGLAGSRSLTN